MFPTNLNTLTSFIEKCFMRLPPLPDNIKHAVVKYLPHLTTITSVAVFLGSGILGIVLKQDFRPITVLYCTACVLISFILIRSVRPLSQKKRVGWQSLYFTILLVGILTIVLTNSIVLITIVIVLYFLFQIQNEYHAP